METYTDTVPYIVDHFIRASALHDVLEPESGPPNGTEADAFCLESDTEGADLREIWENRLDTKALLRGREKPWKNAETEKISDWQGSWP